jgi:hypothetical protein
MTTASWLFGLLFMVATVLAPLVWMAAKNKNTVLEGWKRT